jgi:hypothetical protein
MAQASLKLPANLRKLFRPRLCGLLSADADLLESVMVDAAQGEMADAEGECKRLMHLLNGYVDILDQIGWEPSEGDGDIEVTAETGVLITWLEEQVDELSEDAAVAAGHYRDNTCDPDELARVSERARWLTQTLGGLRDATEAVAA